MKKINLKIISVQIFALISNNCFSQELITNGSFEAKSQAPHEQNQLDRCLNWESDPYTYDLNGHPGLDWYGHSPDYYFHGAYSPHGNAHTGNGYVGMYNYELFEQPIILTEGNHYIFNINIKLREHGLTGSGNTPFANSSLRIILGKHKMRYRETAANDQDCNSPLDYSELKDGFFQDVVEIARINLDFSTYPANSWHEITGLFQAPKDANINVTGYYDYIGFELVSNNTTSCYDGYLLLDDISITNMCDNFCVNPNRTPVTFGWMSGNVFHPGFIPDPVGVGNNGGTFHPFILYITNATYVHFSLFNGFGDRILNLEYFDPAGLRDPVLPPGSGFWPDKALLWDGISPSGSCFPIGVYAYQVEIRNCVSYYTHSGILNFINVSSIGCHQIPDLYNSVVPNCCPDHISYDGINFSGVSRTDMRDYIHVGYTSMVTVSSGANIKWHAGNDVSIGSFYQVSSGADVEMKIVPCGTARDVIYSNEIDDRIPNYDILKVDEKINTDTYYAHIYPSVVESGFQILSNKVIELVDIYSSDGKHIISFIDRKEIEISNLRNGLYIAQIKSKEGNTTYEKFIKK